MNKAVGIWITGLPASGKSTITAALKPKLEAEGLRVEVLESDDVRQVLTPPRHTRAMSVTCSTVPSPISGTGL